jgi:hypothetical protein
MDKLHIKLIDSFKFEPREGQCDDLVCSNKKSITHCPSLGFISNNNSEDVALDYLAKVLVEAFLDTQEYERNNTSKQ